MLFKEEAPPHSSTSDSEDPELELGESAGFEVVTAQALALALVLALARIFSGGSQAAVIADELLDDRFIALRGAKYCLKMSRAPGLLLNALNNALPRDA